MQGVKDWFQNGYTPIIRTTGGVTQVIFVVSHRNGFRAEYSGRNLAEYSAETVSVKIMSFGDERNIL